MASTRESQFGTALATAIVFGGSKACGRWKDGVFGYWSSACELEEWLLRAPGFGWGFSMVYLDNSWRLDAWRERSVPGTRPLVGLVTESGMMWNIRVDACVGEDVA